MDSAARIVRQGDLARRSARGERRRVYYLCTDQSSYVTGAELHIKGGLHV
mgnify:FL=1